MTVRVEAMTGAHREAVLRIYAAGIAGGDATFETVVPAWEAFDAGKLPDLRFVAVSGDDVVGWVACSRVSPRAVYAGVVEHSVYIDPAHGGRGIGRTLLETLIAATEAAGVWTIQSGVFPENAASVALHRRCGFREIGVRERVGHHRGRWRDVILFERRSPVIT